MANKLRQTIWLVAMIDKHADIRISCKGVLNMSLPHQADSMGLRHLRVIERAVFQ